MSKCSYFVEKIVLRIFTVCFSFWLRVLD